MPDIQPARTGKAFWRVKSVRKLSPEENRGKHNVYVNVYRDGRDVRGGSVRVRWGWDGMSEAPQLASLEKPVGEHAANFPIFLGSQCWVEVADGLNGSEIVSGLTSALPDEPLPADWVGGNTNGHHSWLVEFEWADLDETPHGGHLSEVYACVDRLLAALAKVEKRT